MVYRWFTVMKPCQVIKTWISTCDKFFLPSLSGCQPGQIVSYPAVLPRRGGGRLASVAWAAAAARRESLQAAAVPGTRPANTLGISRAEEPIIYFYYFY